MRLPAIAILLNMLCLPCVQAAGIDYDRIPSDATAYLHLDFAPIVSSKLCQAVPEFAPTIAQITTYAGNHADFTAYTVKSGGADGLVVLIHSPDSALSKFVKAGNTSTLGDFRVIYKGQEIIYSNAGFGGGLQPTTQPTALTQSAASAATTHPAEEHTDSHIAFSLGLEVGAGTRIDQFLYGGPCYAAFVGPDLIVATGSLPLMAGAIDILQGARVSLGRSDPQGIKMTSPPGAWVLAAGVNVVFARGLLDHEQGTPGPNGEASKQTGGTGMDMFGSLKSKARLGRFDMGEDEKSLYLDGTFAMDDAESAIQLRNLSTGVQALLTLSQPQVRVLVAPLKIGSADKDVRMRWTWPAEKLPELVQAIKQLNTKSN
jgi:hypothetical protein